MFSVLLAFFNHKNDISSEITSFHLKRRGHEPLSMHDRDPGDRRSARKPSSSGATTRLVSRLFQPAVVSACGCFSLRLFQPIYLFIDRSIYIAIYLSIYLAAVSASGSIFNGCIRQRLFQPTAVIRISQRLFQPVYLSPTAVSASGCFNLGRPKSGNNNGDWKTSWNCYKGKDARRLPHLASCFSCRAPERMRLFQPVSFLRGCFVFVLLSLTARSSVAVALYSAAVAAGSTVYIRINPR